MKQHLTEQHQTLITICNIKAKGQVIKAKQYAFLQYDSFFGQGMTVKCPEEEEFLCYLCV